MNKFLLGKVDDHRIKVELRIQPRVDVRICLTISSNTISSLSSHLTLDECGGRRETEKRGRKRLLNYWNEK